MSDQTKDRVLERIRKMLALAADNGASEGERDNALRMAHATLAKYNLTLSEVEAAEGKAKEPRVLDTTLTRDQPFTREIAYAIAQLYFCGYFYTKKQDGSGKVKHSFVGRAGNVMTAKLLTDYVVASVISEANKLWKQQRDPGPWWTSFCKGAASAVALRCHRLRYEAEKADEEEKKPKPAAVMVGEDGEPVAAIAAPVHSTALALVTVYKAEREENDRWIEDNIGPLERKTSRQKEVGDGYAEGVKLGSKISLNRQVGVSDRKRIG